MKINSYTLNKIYIKSKATLGDLRVIIKYFILLIFYYSPKRIKRFRNIHKNKTIFCLGAGPSLNNENLSLLNDQIVIFTNSSYKINHFFDSAASYWMVQDSCRLRELKHIDRKQFSGSFKSTHNLETLTLDLFNKDDVFLMPEVKFIRSENCCLKPFIEDNKHNFSLDLHNVLGFAGHSVIFSAIQLAYYMGAKEIVLLGVDMNYSKGPNESYFDESINREFWPINYIEHSKPAFEYYNDFLKSRDVKLINSTKGTKEDVTLKKHLDEIFN